MNLHSKILSQIFWHDNMDSCIYDILDQCYHDCDRRDKCPRAEIEEPDWDFIRDLQREEQDDA